MDPDTLIGPQMNGALLPVDHGAPARMIVPGWIGTYWVKWVGWLTVSSAEIRNYRTDEYYVIDRATVTRQNIKSSLCLPFPAWLQTGRQTLTGFARGGGVEIARVEWSANSEPWQEAELTSPVTRWGWVPFRFDWEAVPGDRRIRTRATGVDGQTQPEQAYMNPGTMLYNAIIPHPVTVSA